MNMGQKGFTLLELLIAAALVGVLTMFATQTFRQTASDIRVENAKRGADTIAVAAFRYEVAYPGELTGGTLSQGNPPLSTLVERGFLEEDRAYWDEDDFVLTLTAGPSPSVTVSVNPGSTHIRGFSGYTTDVSGFVQAGY